MHVSPCFFFGTHTQHAELLVSETEARCQMKQENDGFRRREERPSSGTLPPFFSLKNREKTTAAQKERMMERKKGGKKTLPQ